MNKNFLDYKNVQGIYTLSCSVNHKIYVGSAVDMYHRWHTHLCSLRKGKHHSQHLQWAYNKYGEDAFTFSVIELVEDREILRIREQYWMDYFQSYNRDYGYNNYPVAGSPPRVKKGPLPDEIRHKISASKLGKKRGPLTESWKENISKKLKGKKLGPESRERQADTIAYDWLITSPDGKQYTIRNLNKFCRENNLNLQNMHKVAKGERKHSKGWKCEYA